MNLDKLLELCEKATSGPWKVFHKNPDSIYVGNWDIDQTMISLPVHNLGEERALKEAAYISAANPETVKALVLSLQEAMKALEWHGSFKSKEALAAIHARLKGIE